MPYVGECGHNALPGSGSTLVRITALLALAALVLACYNPERDLIQDPFNTPLIHILDSDFVPATGGVSVRWEFLGSESLNHVLILRRIGSTFDSIGVVTQLTPVGSGRFVDEWEDSAPPAGELLEYTVSARLLRGRVDARAIQVQIPGARILRLRRNPFQGSIQVDWQSVGANITSFDVVRLADGVSSSLGRVGTGESSFVDTDLVGNVEYAYRIDTIVSGGRPLQSSILTSSVYSLERTEVVSGGGTHLSTASGSSATSSTTLAAVSAGDEVEINKYRYFFGVSFDGTKIVGAIREERVDSRLDDIDPMSVRLAGPNVFIPASSGERAFVVGLTSSRDRVVVEGLSLPNLRSVWSGPSDWQVTSQTSGVAVTQGGDGNTYVTDGRLLRAFGSTFQEVGSQTLPFVEPSDLDSDGDRLWAVVPAENRLYRAELSTGPSSLQWEAVDLGVPGLEPRALTLNRFGQVFVLDGGSSTVYAFDADLTPLLSWALPSDDYTSGGLILDGGSGNLIHVHGASGSLHTYLP